MKKGQSYITVTEANNPNHTLIKALKDKGINNAHIIFAPKYDSDCGWTMVNSDCGSCWLNYTIKEVLITINQMPYKRDYFNSKNK